MHENESKRVSRRHFVKTSAVAAAALSGIPQMRTAAAAKVGVKSKPDVVIYEGNYPGWPWVTADGKGRLFCVFRDDSVHGFSPTGKVMFTRSEDGGKTWTKARAVVDEPGVDDRNAAITAMPDGSLMLVYNTYTKEKKSQARYTRSTDLGEKWWPEKPLSDEDTRTRSAPVALSNGDTLVPIYTAPGNGSVAVVSGDGGRRWDSVRLPDAEGYLGDEWDVAEVERGRLIGMHRNSHKTRKGFFWKTESRDYGRTWSKPVRTNVRSARAPSPPSLGFHGKALVLTYADRRMVSVSMVISGDSDFVQWDVMHRHPCYQYRADGKPIADASYPVSVQIGADRRFVVDYEIHPESKRIAGYFVDVPAGWG